MKLIFFVLAALAAFVGLWYFAHGDSGTVAIDMLGVQRQLPGWMVIAALLIGFVILYFLFRIIGALLGAPKTIKKSNAKRRVDKAHNSTARGYSSLIEGDWDKAEKTLLSQIDDHPSPALNYLAAANAAQQREDYAARDKYILNALDASPRDRLAIGLTKARLLYQSGQLEEALETLNKLKRLSPNNPRVSRLLVEVGRQAGDWEGVNRALKNARTTKALPAEEIHEIETESNRKLLSLPPPPGSLNPVKDIDSRYKQLPAARRGDARVLETYAGELMKVDAHDKAEKVIRKSLNKRWDQGLVLLYGNIESTKPEDQLKQAETWAANHPDDPDLLLTLGRLAVQNKIWGKARTYLENCIAHGGKQEAHRELGKLFEQLGESELALTTYRSGMDRAVITDESGSSTAMIASDTANSGVARLEHDV